jgi:hypothetical protein
LQAARFPTREGQKPLTTDREEVGVAAFVLLRDFQPRDSAEREALSDVRVWFALLLPKGSGVPLASASEDSLRTTLREPTNRDPVDSMWAAHAVLCGLLAGFHSRPVATIESDRVEVVELPIFDLHGMRPYLWWWLRRAYLAGMRGKPMLGSCARGHPDVRDVAHARVDVECGRFYPVGRKGQTYCSKKCSWRSRNLAGYYERERERRQKKARLQSRRTPRKRRRQK